MRYTSFEPLSAELLFKMQPGDTFRAYWEKDDNPDDVRLDYDLIVVGRNENGFIHSLDYCWEFSKDEMTDDPSENMLDLCGRGYCYLYKTGHITSGEMMDIIEEVKFQATSRA